MATWRAHCGTLQMLSLAVVAALLVGIALAPVGCAPHRDGQQTSTIPLHGTPLGGPARLADAGFTIPPGSRLIGVFPRPVQGIDGRTPLIDGGWDALFAIDGDPGAAVDSVLREAASINLTMSPARTYRSERSPATFCDQTSARYRCDAISSLQPGVSEVLSLQLVRSRTGDPESWMMLSLAQPTPILVAGLRAQLVLGDPSADVGPTPPRLPSHWLTLDRQGLAIGAGSGLETIRTPPGALAAPVGSGISCEHGYWAAISAAAPEEAALAFARHLGWQDGPPLQYESPPGEPVTEYIASKQEDGPLYTLIAGNPRSGGYVFVSACAPR